VIIPDAGEFNAVSSKNVDKIDSRLTELPDKMKRADVMDLIYRSFMLGSNTHITGEPAQGLGSGGFIYTGDLDTKSPENIWTLGDWENVASAFGFETDVSQVEKGFKVDFTKAVGKEGEELQLGYGIIVNQADLRGIPSLKACYASPAASEDDACAFHRAHIEPVRILWKGNGWTFVKTQQEYGWVQDKDLAVATRADVDVLLNSPVVVKEFSFVRDDVRFDMGTSLPFGGDGENADWMAVLVPSKDDDGNVKWKKMSMPSEYVEVMPKYTYETVVNLLLGEMTEGIWLLANKSFKGVEGVDCSGATKKALEVAGLLLGRNSGSAQGLQGKSLWERPAGLVMEKQPEADPQKIQTTMDKNLKALQSSKDEIGAVFKKWHEDMLSGRPRGILLVGWNGHIGIFLGYDDAGRAVVFSSLSRVKRMNGASQPEDVWLLEPTITPLDTIETDPDNGQLITPGQGFPASWYGRITYVRELAE
jgi:hypothetical protein